MCFLWVSPSFVQETEHLWPVTSPPAATSSWKAAGWERRSAITTASKASHVLNPSPTASLMASGTRSPLPSVPPTCFCTLTVTGNTHTYRSWAPSHLCHKRLCWVIFPMLLWSDMSNELPVFIRVNICSMHSPCGEQGVSMADSKTFKDRLTKRKAVYWYNILCVSV